jgi:ribonuclease BN (tRNA processing enzyme)
VYSGDCGVADDLLPLMKPGDVLLAEAGFGVRRVADGIHLTAGEAGAVAQRAGAARLVLTHCASGVAPDDLIAAARAEFSGPVEIAQPGLTLDIS